MITSVTARGVSLLTASDRCDRCGAAAEVLALLTSGGGLLFGDHHARRHRTLPQRVAVWIEGSAGEPAPARP